MLTREQLLDLCDEASRKLGRLRVLISCDSTAPPAPIVANVVTTLAKVADSLERLDDDIRLAAGRR